MQERALKARSLFIKNPKLSQIDDEMLVWSYDKKDNLWYSILGNYSQYSPEEKRVKQSKYEQELFEVDEKIKEKIEKKYDDLFYESEIRQAVIERDNYTCQRCGLVGNSKFHVHHILKRIAGGTNHLDNLILVCPKCHSNLDKKLYNPKWTI